MKLLLLLFTVILQSRTIVSFQIPHHSSQYSNLAKNIAAGSSTSLNSVVQTTNNIDNNGLVDRKTFSKIAFVSTFCSILLPAQRSWSADDDGLSMPTPAEQKAIEEAELAARLKRKAELQKKKSNKMDFNASLKNEKQKKEDLKMSKEERRNALCEDLGRGC